MTKKVAVLLSGCGYLDGAEIRESVLTLLALDEQEAEVEIFAPDQTQHHTINHHNGNEENGPRNILAEAGRIARGKVSPLKDASAADFDALIIPGGFGVAKNLCDFAFKGSEAKALADVKNLIESFYDLKKPIGAICIAPALVALCLGEKKVSLTIGNDKETALEIEKTGAKHLECPVNEARVDESNKIVSTPAYMFDDAPLAEINKGIKDCVSKTLSLT